MGAVMSIACFPMLFWGWLNSDGPIVKGAGWSLCFFAFTFTVQHGTRRDGFGSRGRHLSFAFACANTSCW
jgi:hypothetical protein